MKTKTTAIEKLKSINYILVLLSLFKLLLLIIFAGNYGFFRDEYYYIETSRHLAWGYVDLQPFSAVILDISRTLFGDSILGIRIFSYLAGSAIVFISGLIARELQGSRFTQIFTGFSVIFSGVVLGVSGYFSMNSFDILFASLMFYFLLRMINTGIPKYWIIIGILFGIGLQNKLTFLFLGLGLLTGILLTKYRQHLKSKELWIGALIALILFLPNIIWQISNNYPTLEFMHNAAAYKNRPMSFVEFTLGVINELNPLYTMFILTGIYFLFFNKKGNEYKIIGWIFISIFLVFAFSNGKPYYMGVLFPVIIASGVVGADYLIEKYLRNFVRIILFVTVFLFGLIVIPFAIPVFDADTFIMYSQTLGKNQTNSERSELGLLPQFYSDRFGWEEMVKKVASAYNKLTDEEKNEVLIFGQNYGEAGAVNFYREKYNLPLAISSHNNYWFWGYPKDFTGNVLIVIGSNLEENSKYFHDVKLVESHFCKYGMPFENVGIFICRDPKYPINIVWKRIKFFI